MEQRMRTLLIEERKMSEILRKDTPGKDDISSVRKLRT
jgi:hypothetical protein